MTTELSLVRKVLHEYSEELASEHDVMRLLTLHYDWYVPVLFFPDIEEQGVEDLILFSTEYSFPADELWLFTDMEMATLAQEQGALLGPYVSDVVGTDIFSNLPSNISLVRINCFSPTSDQWVISQAGFDLAKLWAEVITLELHLLDAKTTPDKTLLEELANFDSYIILMHSHNHHIVTLVNYLGFESAGLIFTAPDNLDAFLGRFAEKEAKNFKRPTLNSQELFSLLSEADIDGIIFNPFSLEKAFPISICDDIKCYL